MNKYLTKKKKIKKSLSKYKCKKLKENISMNIEKIESLCRKSFVSISILKLSKVNQYI